MKTGDKVTEKRRIESFVEDVSKLLSGGNEEHGLGRGDLVTNKMNIKFYMFGPNMLDRVAGEVHGTNVVTIHNGVTRYMVDIAIRLGGGV